MAPKYIREPARETPVLLDTDVLIAGGGPAPQVSSLQFRRQKMGLEPPY